MSGGSVSQPAPASTRDVTVTHRRIPISGSMLGADNRTIAATIFLPNTAQINPIVFCCLPGGAVSRRYWDLRPGGDDSYSFALCQARAGFPVICVDHLGTGESTLPPDDSPAPLLDQVVAVNDAAFGQILDELRDTVPDLRSVGVGHSMGALLTVRQQAVHETYNAVALLGFGFAGLPTTLPEAILTAAHRGIPGDQELAELTIRMFGSPYPVLSGRGPAPGISGTTRVPDAVRQAMAECGTVLLGSAGLLSLLPGNVAAEAMRLRAPVLVVNGSDDPLIANHTPGADDFPRAIRFTSRVLPQTDHNVNIAPARHQLWASVRDWAERTVSSTR
jgi:alpha-beta hydrolase superfamily lysophospholipase